MTYPTMCTGLCLIQCSQAQRTDMTGPVITGSDTIMHDGRGANEADLCLDIFLTMFRLLLSIRAV